MAVDHGADRNSTIEPREQRKVLLQIGDRRVVDRLNVVPLGRKDPRSFLEKAGRPAPSIRRRRVDEGETQTHD